MRRGFGMALVAAFCFQNCNEEASEIGADFFTDGSFTISSIDTLSLKLSTVLFDSMATNNTGRILIGHHKDEKLGRITASGFFQVGLDNPFSIDESSTSFDYAVIALMFDGYHYYDTTVAQTFSVHEVTEEIDPSSGLYNTSSFSYSRESLGSSQFYPKPGRKDTLEIPLSDRYGRGLYEMIVNDESEVSSNENFLEYLKGIAIMADTTVNGSILGFGVNPELRIYYLDKLQVPAERKSVAFKVSNLIYVNNYFSQVKTDRSKTRLSSLYTLEEDMPSDETEGQAYMQSGAGLAIRVEIPHVRTLLQFENFIISNAILEIKPVGGSYDMQTYLPSPLTAYVANKNNYVTSQLVETGALTQDLYLDRDTKYELNITEFLNSQLTIDEFNENALLLVLDDTQFRSKVDRLYTDTEMKLTIYYAAIKN